MKRMSALWFSSLLAGLTLLAIAFSAPGYAQVKPGDFITPENATKVKDLVGPGVYYKVERGMTMKIVPAQRVDWPPPYKDATEKYSSQVRLSQDKRSIVGFEVTYSSLQSAHLRHHAGIRPAYMAKQSLRHCLRSSTLSDQSGRARGIA